MPNSLPRGVRDDALALYLCLPVADGPYLDGALENPCLSVDHVLLMLRNLRLTPSHARRIASDSRFSGARTVQAGLVRHPSTPTDLALALAPALSTVDLCRVAEDSRLPSSLRERSEALLSARIFELPPGEQIALAGRAGRTLLSIFCKSDSPSVLASLIENPRVSEEDVVRICRNPATGARTLEAIAMSGRWSCARSVRLALARHPSAWVADSLRCLQGLLSGDLEAIARDEGARRIVRIGAERTLARRRSLTLAEPLEAFSA